MVNDGIFDSSIAPSYDAHHRAMFEPGVIDPTVALLTELAAGGRVLEFASGTGRLTLPLRRAGIDVHGIELSQAMVAEMRAKPDGDEVPVTIGDMATTRVPGTFSLVYLVFNTVANLLTQDEQVACFVNAAAHLAPGGRFVIELYVPQLRWLAPGDQALANDVGPVHAGIDEYDVVEQGLVSHHFWTDDAGTTVVRTPQRYIWPSELDLMARLAGMAREHRWAGWDRSPFTADSTSHVSVFVKP
ncbi:MAG: class I SAM-dependent methyltransferase [Actinomycetota bacterium]